MPAVNGCAVRPLRTEPVSRACVSRVSVVFGMWFVIEEAELGLMVTYMFLYYKNLSLESLLVCKVSVVRRDC